MWTACTLEWVTEDLELLRHGLGFGTKEGGRRGGLERTSGRIVSSLLLFFSVRPQKINTSSASCCLDRAVFAQSPPPPRGGGGLRAQFSVGTLQYTAGMTGKDAMP